MVTESILTGDR